MTARFRYWLWRHVSRLPWVCPAGAHGRIINGEPNEVSVNWVCRADLEAIGSCWCGKLKYHEAEASRG